MASMYALTCDLSLIADEIASTLKEKHSSTLCLDHTNFVGETSTFRVDTYQVLNLYWRGYVTINVYFFRPDMAKDELRVKVALFSSYWKNSTRLMEKLQRELHAIILAHGGTEMVEE